MLIVSKNTYLPVTLSITLSTLHHSGMQLCESSQVDYEICDYLEFKASEAQSYMGN